MDKQGERGWKRASTVATAVLPSPWQPPPFLTHTYTEWVRWLVSH